MDTQWGEAPAESREGVESGGLCGSRHDSGKYCGRAWAWISALQFRTLKAALAQEGLALPLHAV